MSSPKMRRQSSCQGRACWLRAQEPIAMASSAFRAAGIQERSEASRQLQKGCSAAAGKPPQLYDHSFLSVECGRSGPPFSSSALQALPRTLWVTNLPHDAPTQCLQQPHGANPRRAKKSRTKRKLWHPEPSKREGKAHIDQEQEMFNVHAPATSIPQELEIRSLADSLLAKTFREKHLGPASSTATMARLQNFPESKHDWAPGVSNSA